MNRQMMEGKNWVRLIFLLQLYAFGNSFNVSLMLNIRIFAAVIPRVCPLPGTWAS